MGKENIVNKLLKEDWGTIESEVFESNCSNFVYKPDKKLPIHALRPKLPIFTLRSQVFYLLEDNQVLDIVSETGCGKSSFLNILETWYVNCKLLGITRLRRSADASLATTGAEEKNVLSEAKWVFLSLLMIWNPLLEIYFENVW